MTAMPIDNHPLTQRRLQFIGISVNKLTLKNIYIINRQATTTLLAALSAVTKTYSLYENPGYLD